VAATQTKITLRDLPLGGRLIVRSRKDWRVAVISRLAEDQATLSIASPSGYSYRLRKPLDMSVTFDGMIPCLETDHPDTWRENFSTLDRRW
jgi:hypothetical protein